MLRNMERKERDITREINARESFLYVEQQTISNDLLFNKFMSTNNGGLLFFKNTSVTYFPIESSSFFSSKISNNRGEAIYKRRPLCFT